MPAQMRLSTLRHLDLTTLADAGFTEAAKAAADGLEQLEPVHRVISSGDIWSGAGQPEATSVLQNNRLALDVTAIRMDTAAQAVSGLSSALVNFQVNVRAIAERLESNGATVHEDGTVSVGGSVADQSLNTNNAYVRALQENLKLATLADLDCKAALDRLSDEVPWYSAVADPAGIAHNRSVLDQALAHREDVRTRAALWPNLVGTSLDQVGERSRVTDERLQANLDVLIDAYRASGGPADFGVLDILRGDLGEGARSAGLDALSQVFAPERLGRYLKPIGIAQLVLDAWIFPAVKSEDDPRVTVDTHGGPEVKVFDQDLADIVSDYYPQNRAADDAGEGSGTLADRAHYQRVTGESPDGKDWVAEAKATRARLLSWMGTQGGGPGDLDREYAGDLIAELDAALGDTPEG